MANVTVRNIPDPILEKIKALSARERRSMNNEILVLLEQAVGLHDLGDDVADPVRISPETQMAIWRSLAGTWDDERSAEEIIRDIYENRTPGRDIDL